MRLALTIELSGLLAASDVPVYYEGRELIRWTRAFSLDGPLTVILREPATLGCLVASDGSTLLSTVHRECIYSSLILRDSISVNDFSSLAHHIEPGVDLWQ